MIGGRPRHLSVTIYPLRFARFTVDLIGGLGRWRCCFLNTCGFYETPGSSTKGICNSSVSEDKLNLPGGWWHSMWSDAGACNVPHHHQMLGKSTKAVQNRIGLWHVYTVLNALLNRCALSCHSENNMQKIAMPAMTNAYEQATILTCRPASAS